jgi:hypothetical protein
VIVSPASGVTPKAEKAGLNSCRLFSGRKKGYDPRMLPSGPRRVPVPVAPVGEYVPKIEVSPGCVARKSVRSEAPVRPVETSCAGNVNPYVPPSGRTA